MNVMGTALLFGESPTLTRVAGITETGGLTIAWIKDGDQVNSRQKNLVVWTLDSGVSDHWHLNFDDGSANMSQSSRNEGVDVDRDKR